MAKLDPIISEFETEEDAEAYDKWFREQVEAGLAESDEGNVPHEEVMRKAQAIIDKYMNARPDLAA
jgi:predicted transcriptional regulator